MTNRRNILRNFVAMLGVGVSSLFAGKLDKKKLPAQEEYFTVSLMGGPNSKYNWSVADKFMPVEGVMINAQGTIHSIVVKK